MKRTLLRWLATGGALYLLLTLAIFALQDTMIYYPTRAPETALFELAETKRVEPWRSRAGELLGWRRPNSTAKRKMLVFHGNAGFALHRVHFIEALQALGGGSEWEVFVQEYPGYGARGGETNEPSILAAGRAALDELAALDARPVFLMGESLGSGAACGLAGALPERVAGVALVVPYGSLLEAASHHYPYLPVRLILRDRFDNYAALARYRGPVAFVIAGEDEVVTAASGLRLHESYGGPKHLRLFPGLGHNELDYSSGAAWWEEISNYLTQPRP
ncbi:MAG TPA: alpha/beta fold hydrolase [Chthoniobacteraceae bacterium]|jgi:hypothetical protein